MTPKEKCIELVDKMEKNFQYFASREIAKKHALIAVDEILDDDMYGMEEEHFEKRINYWQQVKQEIEKI